MGGLVLFHWYYYCLVWLLSSLAVMGDVGPSVWGSEKAEKVAETCSER